MHVRVHYTQFSTQYRWAMAEGYGASLIYKPELVADMVRQARSRSGLPVSVKMRVHKDLK